MNDQRPAAQPAYDPPDSALTQAGGTLASGQILLVEDEAHLRLVLARVLEATGYGVRAVGTVAEAVAQVTRACPDILVLDVNLPDGTGWGVLRQIAAQGIACATLPTIVISAGQVAPTRMAEFQPWAFLPKPFPVAALQRLVAAALETKGGGAAAPPEQAR